MALKVEYKRWSKRVTSTARWRTLRAFVLERDGWACVDCGKRGRLEIDHVLPVRTHPHLAYDPGNCAARCAACHTRKTRLEVGHKPTPEDRQKWRDCVLTLERQGKENPKQNGVSHA